MNTVGKSDTLAGSICSVVSISMLTDGWDARTVTHVLGSAPSARSSSASRSSGARCAASRTTLTTMAASTSSTPTSSVSRSTSPPEPVPVKPQKPRETVRITRQWLDDHLVCKGGTYPAQLMYQELAYMACERITARIVPGLLGERPILRGAST